MARLPDVIRPVKLTTTLPEDIRVKLDLHLYSDLEHRVPKGAYQRFIMDRIQEFFHNQTLNLAEYCNAPVTTINVRGSPAAISILKEMLRGLNYDHS